MYQKNEKSASKVWVKHIDFILIDMLCLQVAFLIAYLSKFHGANPYIADEWIAFAFLIEFIDLFWILIASPFHGILRRGHLKELVSLIKQAVVLAAAFSLFVFAVKQGVAYSRIVLASTCLIYILLSFLVRTGWKKYLQKCIRTSVRRQLLIGSGELAVRYVQQIQKLENAQEKIVGYLAHEPCDKLTDYAGDYSRLDEWLAEGKADEVIVALDVKQVGCTNEIVNTCEKYGVRVFVIPFYHDVMSATPSIEEIGNMKLVNLRSTPLDNLSNILIKRTFDICVSLVLILLTSPIMLFAAIGTKLSSPGPILFRQERVGRGKKIFKMLKFRSMRVTGTENTGWSTNNDPRKTKFGSFIRKFSIDELPQFFNVLKGDMSLIGPRPEVPFHVEHFKDEIPLYLVRQQVWPGITGWAQVNGLRGDTSIEERIKHDIWYIENWSFSLDLKIIWMTVFGGMVNKEQLQNTSIHQ